MNKELMEKYAHMFADVPKEVFQKVEVAKNNKKEEATNELITKAIGTEEETVEEFFGFTQEEREQIIELSFRIRKVNELEERFKDKTVKTPTIVNENFILFDSNNISEKVFKGMVSEIIETDDGVKAIVMFEQNAKIIDGANNYRFVSNKTVNAVEFDITQSLKDCKDITLSKENSNKSMVLEKTETEDVVEFDLTQSLKDCKDTFLESGDGNITLSKEVFNKFKSMVEGKAFYFYLTPNIDLFSGDLLGASILMLVLFEYSNASEYKMCLPIFGQQQLNQMIENFPM